MVVTVTEIRSRFVRLNVAGVTDPPVTDAVAEYDPGTLFAVKVGDTATPEAFVVTTFDPPNVAPAPAG